MNTIQDMFEIGMKRHIPSLLGNIQKEGTTMLNLGGGLADIAGTVNVDYPNWDADKQPLPFESESVSVIHAYHFLEHCMEPVKVLQECQRVLIKGGVMNIVVPYYTSQMAAHDLDHKHVFCEETWKNLFDTSYYDKNKIEWKFRIHANFIMGVVERNLALFTQLQKEY